MQFQDLMYRMNQQNVEKFDQFASLKSESLRHTERLRKRSVLLLKTEQNVNRNKRRLIVATKSGQPTWYPGFPFLNLSEAVSLVTITLQILIHPLNSIGDTWMTLTIQLDTFIHIMEGQSFPEEPVGIHITKYTYQYSHTSNFLYGSWVCNGLQSSTL